MERVAIEMTNQAISREQCDAARDAAFNCLAVLRKQSELLVLATAEMVNHFDGPFFDEDTNQRLDDPIDDWDKFRERICDLQIDVKLAQSRMASACTGEVRELFLFHREDPTKRFSWQNSEQCLLAIDFASELMSFIDKILNKLADYNEGMAYIDKLISPQDPELVKTSLKEAITKADIESEWATAVRGIASSAANTDFNHAEISREFCSDSEKQSELSDFGPIEPGRLRGPKAEIEVSRLPWKLIEYMWTRNRVVPEKDLFDYLYPDGNTPNKGLRDICAKANSALHETGFERFLSTRQKTVRWS